MRHVKVLAVAALVLASGCMGPTAAPTRTIELHGRLETGRHPQALMSEVTTSATVSLIDAATGNTVASTLTDASGAFVLTFADFSPADGSSYVLEAVKGLSVGGSANRAGTAAVRLRTYLFWNSGWQSFTNTAVNTGIVMGNATTALSVIVGLKAQAGIPLTLSTLIGKVNEGTDAFTEAGTGLTSAGDFAPVLPLVGNAIGLDQDPLRAIAYDPATGGYSLATGAPWIGGFSPTLPAPGGTLTLHGTHLDRLNGRNTFWFGTVAASTWSVSLDRTSATVSIPATAYSAPLTLQQPGGLIQTIAPFLKLRGTVGTLAGTPLKGTSDGKGNVAQFNIPHGIAIDANGVVYVADHSNNKVRRITPDGTVTSIGTGVAGYQDGNAAVAQFTGPSGPCVDANGNVYVADSGNHRIRKISSDGTVSTVAGGGTAGYLDGPVASAQFNRPMGVGLDSLGNLYVADEVNYCIRKITPAGTVTTFAGTNAAGYVDAVGTNARFNGIQGVAIDRNDVLYVGEYGNHRIRKITPGGSVSTFVGSGTSGSIDGIGTGASISGAHFLAVDPAGNVYFSEYTGHKIRRASPAGVVTTVAGTGTAGFADGPVASALFNAPEGVAIDASGNLYIADYSNHAVRVVTP